MNQSCDNDSALYFVTVGSYEKDLVNIDCNECKTIAAVTREDFINKFGYEEFKKLCEINPSISEKRPY